MITIQLQPTSWTRMDPITQLLFNPEPTPGAVLTCVSWVDQDTFPTSFFRFVGGELNNLAPSCIRHALGQAVVLDHLGWIQIFKDDHPTVIDQVLAQLMSKVVSLVPDPFMNPGHRLPCFRTGRRALGSLRETTLNLSQRSFFLAEEARVGDLLTLVGGEERSKAKVDPNRFGGSRKDLTFVDLNREANEPLPGGCFFDGGGFDPTFNRTMKVELDVSDLTDLEGASFQEAPSWVLRETDGIVPVTPAEAGVTGLVLLFLEPTEETLKC